MKSIAGKHYEIVARKRARLKDACGWTGVLRQAYTTDRTVIGFRKAWVLVPLVYQNGMVGSAGERRYAQLVTSDDITSRED